MKIIPLRQIEPQIGNIYYIDTLNKYDVVRNWYKFEGIVEIIDMDSNDYKLNSLGKPLTLGEETYQWFYWRKKEFVEMKKKGYIKYKSCHHLNLQK